MHTTRPRSKDDASRPSRNARSATRGGGRPAPTSDSATQTLSPRAALAAIRAAATDLVERGLNVHDKGRAFMAHSSDCCAPHT